MDATAEGLSKEVFKALEEASIDPKQMVGFCADTCNVMFGRNKSVSTIFKKTLTDLVAVKCSCHSIHLSSSRAADQWPTQLEHHVHLIFNHISSSPKRRAEFVECVLRLEVQYQPLVAYFTLEVFEEQRKEMAKQ